MAEPRFQHTAKELRFIAGLLEYLNSSSEEHDCVVDGGSLTVYWIDCVMGEIRQDMIGDNQSWCYHPLAQGMMSE